VAGGWQDDDELARKAEGLRQELELDALLVTRSEEGMTLYREGCALHEPARAREVYDVSGAGDTVIATLALAMAAKAPMPQAAIRSVDMRLVWALTAHAGDVKRKAIRAPPPPRSSACHEIRGT
jgi:sugar/nucleoside kinase (ribokinase family)